MAYSTQRDRTTSVTEYTQTPWPLPPLNLFLTSGYSPGVYDLRWDDPSALALNGTFRLMGVNVYRSFDSEYGPYNRITELPVGAGFWRDQTDNELVLEEDVTASFIRSGEDGSGGRPRWVFKTQDPIVREGSQGVYCDMPDEVRVSIDGVFVRPLAVNGFAGEVEINPNIYADVAKQKWDPSLVPGQNSRVTCTYRRNRSLLRTDLGQRVFYRVTSVGVALPTDLMKNPSGDLVETPLEQAASTSQMEIEKLDYIWREAVRRNRFILEQGGERVKIFLRKHAGIRCRCIPDDTHKQPINDCLTCFGSGFEGGFEGPYDSIVAPDDGERRISQKDMGRSLEHSYEVWTGPVPLLSQRDFLVKINGERYSIGSVRFPSNRGMVLQQHFTIGHIDERDIRYRVPVDNSARYSVLQQFVPNGPEREAVTQDTPIDGQLDGRTPVWRNIQRNIGE